MAKSYDAFLSYSSAHDKDTAQQFERGLRKINKKWLKVSALRVFRDRRNLVSGADLRSKIIKAIRSSENLVVLVRPELATHEWVEQEIDEFRRTAPGETVESRIFIALMEGNLRWDERISDWSADSSIPTSMRGVFSQEPLWADFTETEPAERTLDHPAFRGEFLKIAAALHGLDDKEELESEDRQARRREVRRWQGVAVLVASLAVIAFLVNEGRTTAIQETETVRMLNEALDETNLELTVANDALDLANADLESANMQLQSSNASLDTANSDLLVLNGELDAANTALDNANGELESVNSELAESNRQLDIANDELESANEQLSASNDELVIVNGQLDQARAQATTAAGSAICFAQDSDGEIRVRDSNLAFLEGQIATALTEIEELPVLIPASETPTFINYLDVISPLDLRQSLQYSRLVCESRDGYPFQERWGEIGVSLFE